jgi:hypothetical protein
MTDYRSFDKCLNILYDKVYNKDQKRCYVFKPIIKSKITIDDIKRTNVNDWEELWSGKLEYNGFYNGKWVFTKMSETSYPCTVTIGKYDKRNSNLDDLARSELINMAMHYILSEMVIVDQIRHVLLPLANFDVKYGELKRYSSYVANKMNENHGIHEIHEIHEDTDLYVNVYERYFTTHTLGEFLQSGMKDFTIKDWKVLFFQVLFTLSKISERLRKFRHNMLNLDAIRVCRIENGDTAKKYNIAGKVFEVPTVGFEIKITDFDKSYTEDYVRNRDTSFVSENPYYDINYFFQNIIYMVKENGITHPELDLFLLDMVPLPLRVQDKSKFDGLDETLFDAIATTVETPLIILLKNNFFSEFIKESIDNMDFSVSPVDNKVLSSKKLSKKEEGIEYDDVSVTDDLSDGPRLLARNINYDKNMSKKKTSYNSRMNTARSNKNKNRARSSNDDLFNEMEEKYNDRYNDRYDSDEQDNDDYGSNMKRLERDIRNNAPTEMEQEQEEPERMFVRMFSRNRDKKRNNEKDDDFLEEEEEDFSDTSEDVEDESAIRSKSRQNQRAARAKIARAKTRRKELARTVEDDDDISDEIDEVEQIGANIQPDVKNKIINSLPEGYTGEVPDHLKQMLSLPDANKMFGQTNMFRTLNMGGNIGNTGMPNMNQGQFPTNIGSAALPDDIPGLTQPSLDLQATQKSANQSGLSNLPQLGTQVPPQIPQTALQQMPQMPNIPNMPNMPNMLDLQNMPQLQQLPGIQQLPNMSNMPNMPNMPNMLNMPNMPNMQNMPNMFGGSSDKKYKFKVDDKTGDGNEFFF